MKTMKNKILVVLLMSFGLMLPFILFQEARLVVSGEEGADSLVGGGIVQNLAGVLLSSIFLAALLFLIIRCFRRRKTCH